MAQNEWRIWVQGSPRSRGAKSKHNRAYVDAIQKAAMKVMVAPSSSQLIEVEIVFVDERGRPDVDNTAKPILDALNGIAYFDDSQVSAVRITALPSDDRFRKIHGKLHRTFSQLMDSPMFLIVVKETTEPSLADQLRSS